MTATLEQRGPVKVRYVIVGRRGGQPIEVIPKPKRVIEFNGWVLREKLKTGGGLVLVACLGFIASYFGWQGLLALCIVSFVVGFLAGGDTETGP